MNRRWIPSVLLEHGKTREVHGCLLITNSNSLSLIRVDYFPLVAMTLSITQTFRIVALLAIFTIASAPIAHTEDDPASFITVRSIKRGTDAMGNELFDIVVANTHKSQAIFASVGWISISRERETDAYLRPGKEKTIARDQASAREIHVTRATFR